MALGGIYESADGNIHAGELLLHGLSAYVSRKRIAPVEGRPIGQAGRKRVGLVLKPGDKNPGHT